MEDLIIQLLRIFCPHLKKMAAKTGSPIDDTIVNIICRIAETPQKEDDTR